jgi:hypothetical protein
MTLLYPGDAHSRAASMLDFFDSMTYYGMAPTDQFLGYRGSIDNRDKPSSWSEDTLTNWEQFVLTDIKGNPRDGFAWTSHSLRKGATTAAYAIRVNIQKIFGD